MKISVFVFSLFAAFSLRAQEITDGAESALPLEDGPWYASPWIWIVGAAFFILLLVVLTKKKNEG